MDGLNFKKSGTAALLLAPLFIGAPLACGATSIALEPSQAAAAANQTVAVDITVDTGRECINAAEVAIKFPQNIIQISDFSRGGSIMTFWTEFPDHDAIEHANETGQLTFSGGMPGGYCSNIIKGSGANNLLAKVIFKIPGLTVGGEDLNIAEIAILDSTRIYLNDGNGTDEAVSTSPIAITINNEIPRATSAWEESLRADQTPPESFAVEIQRDEVLFDGKYFAIFFTTDKQTGIDYYEVNEQKIAPDQSVARGVWEKGSSPYVLKDQSLKSRITVRAFDKAGNTTEASFIPVIEADTTGENRTRTMWTIAIFLLLVAIGGILLKKRLRSKR